MLLKQGYTICLALLYLKTVTLFGSVTIHCSRTVYVGIIQTKETQTMRLISLDFSVFSNEGSTL